MRALILTVLLSVSLMGQASTKRSNKKSADEGWQMFEGTEAMTTNLPPPEPVRWMVSPLAAERRLEAATNPVLEAREVTNFSVGVRIFDKHLVSLEYSRFQESSGNETFHVDRQFQDLLAWYRRVYARWQGLRFTAGGGLGAYQENLTTSFYDLKQEASSGSQWTAAVGLGMEVEPIEHIIFFLEGRLISGQNLDPNPNSDILGRVAIQF